MEGRFIILTGERGIGKSTICKKVAEGAAGKGERVCGIISHSLFDQNGSKAGFVAEDIATGNRWALGKKAERKLRGPQYGEYTFSKKGFRKAVKRLEKALSSDTTLLILDEVGPLELELKKGFGPFLEQLRFVPKQLRFVPKQLRFVPKQLRSSQEPIQQKREANLLLVVRPSLVEEVELLFQKRECTVYTADSDNRNKLPALIIERITSS